MTSLPQPEISKALQVMRAAGLDKYLRDVRQEDLIKARGTEGEAQIGSQLYHAAEIVGYTRHGLTPPPGISVGTATAFSMLGFFINGKESVPGDNPWAIYWPPSDAKTETHIQTMDALITRFVADYNAALPEGYRISIERKKGQTLMGDLWTKYTLSFTGGEHCGPDKCMLVYSPLVFHEPKTRDEGEAERAPDFIGGHAAHAVSMPIAIKVGMGAYLEKIGGEDVRDVWLRLSRSLPLYAAVYVAPRFNDRIPVVFWQGEPLFFLDPALELAHLQEPG